ncbi:MBOAT family protein [Candidatus Poribacteria bacterium]|nr:MBOAT family protein [Candidatus Poribacteria bacterium]
MLFHSWHFVIFFVIVYLVYLPLRKTRFYLYWLLAASYLFYGWWNPLYLILIVYSTAINYYAVVLMARTQKQKPWLIVSIVNSFGVLGFFKYGVFVTDNLNALLSILKMPFTIATPGIFLPVGISFYTFHAMSYTIDFYRGNIPKEPSFIRFATFIALFPQLVAGPIVRAGDMLPQLTGKPEIRKENITDGLSLFFVGLFKKVALADYLALYVDKVYAAPALFDGLSLVLATFAFGWQIYFDFSGYTDMARGIARLMGFNLKLNFNNPYLATSLGDFWNRWHISLSSWFKDYLYIPLGGNRKGQFNTYKNMFLTMVISGLWHGAAWTFVIWGALHALGRFLTRELERTTFYNEKVPMVVKQVSVFAFVTFAWIFFRAESFSDATLIVNRIFSAGLANPNFPLVALFFCLSIWIYQFLFEARINGRLNWMPIRVGVMCFILLYLMIFTTSGHEAFIYFQF